jgi:hypothetical protein
LQISTAWPKERLACPRRRGGHQAMSEGLSPEDVRAIILAIMRIEEKLDELLGEDEDNGEEEDLS